MKSQKMAPQFVRFLQQNAASVLLAALLCAALTWLYGLSTQSAYQAVAIVRINTDHDVALNTSQKNYIEPLFFSQSVLNAALSNQRDKEISTNKLSVIDDKETYRFTSRDGRENRAKDRLQSWISSITIAIDSLNEQTRQKKMANDLQLETDLNIVLENYTRDLHKLTVCCQDNLDLAQLSKDLSALIIKRLQAESQVMAIERANREGVSLLALPFIANRVDIKDLTNQQYRLDRQIAFMQSQLGFKHPQIKAMTAEREALLSQVNQKISLSVDQIYSEREQLSSSEKNLKLYIEKNGSQFKKSTIDEVLYNLRNKILPILTLYLSRAKEDHPWQTIYKVEVVEPIKVIENANGANLWLSIGLVFILSLLVFGFIAHFLQSKKSSKKSDISSVFYHNDKAAQINETENESKYRSISMEELLLDVGATQKQCVIFLGEYSAQSAAEFSLRMVQVNKRAILIDVDGDQIEKLIGPHRGLNDVLTGDAAFLEVIYQDHDTGVDILPKGVASSLRAGDFSQDVDNMIHLILENYDIIAVVCNEVKEKTVCQFIKNADLVVISSKTDDAKNTFATDPGVLGDKKVCVLK